ncbi:hypothetical protein [Thiopseudomonas denitrificans]|uniref:hypothetical protein n=1 Tax=Thiopseudomonas denitrificans TaxID=1501432 RepID=UPI000C762CC0|nr:hypothetical protein [Thiopseudomonas denitrificans]
MSEEEKLLAALSNPAVKEFIDIKKLANSQALIKASEFAAAHAIKHGDRIHIEKIVTIFKDTKYMHQIIKWFCFRCGLECKLDEGSPIFIRSSSPPNVDVQLRNFINAKPSKIQGASKPAPKPALAKAKITVKKTKKSPKKIDMLDSWARFPGSFGSGKRG